MMRQVPFIVGVVGPVPFALLLGAMVIIMAVAVHASRKPKRGPET